MIIIGSKGLLKKCDDVIVGSCPSCKGDLVLHELKEWFSLYFIPVFPFRTVESLYKCMSCEQAYKESIKRLLKDNGKKHEELKKKSEIVFVRALAACMTHMALADGSISDEEQDLIDKIADNETHAKEVDIAVRDVKKDNDYVFRILSEAREMLTSQGVLMILVNAAKVLLADGRVDRRERELFKEYLLACGLPKSLYSDVIRKIKADG